MQRQALARMALREDLRYAACALVRARSGSLRGDHSYLTNLGCARDGWEYSMCRAGMLGTRTRMYLMAARGMQEMGQTLE